MELTQTLTALYRAYLEAWNGREFDRLANFFDEPSVIITPAGAASFASRAAYQAHQRQGFADYEARGYSHTVVGEITAAEVGEGLATLDAPLVCRMHADGSIMERRRAHYILRRTPDGWRFTAVASCIIA